MSARALKGLDTRGACCTAAPAPPCPVPPRPFESWTSNSDWTTGLPAGEVVLCLAAGASFVAVATSAQVWLGGKCMNA